MKLRWSMLKSLAGSKLVNSSFVWILIVPVLAQALQAIPDKIHVPIWGTSFQLYLTLPFRWTCFYFAALSFSAALAVYYVWCPLLVRRYCDYGDYRSRHRGSARLSETFVRFLCIHTERWGGELLDDLVALQQSLRASSNVDLNAMLKAIPNDERTTRRHYDPIVAVCTASETARSDIFDFLWSYDDRKARGFAFWTSASLFLLGFGLMAIVFGEGLWAVISVMI